MATEAGHEAPTASVGHGEAVHADPTALGLNATAWVALAMLVALADAGWVTPGSVVLVERRASSRPASWPAGWDELSTRRYGDTRVELAEVG